MYASFRSAFADAASCATALKGQPEQELTVHDIAGTHKVIPSLLTVLSFRITRHGLHYQ